MKDFFASLTARLLDARSAPRLLALCAIWLLITAGVRPLMLPDEGRYVGVAWEMLSSGNWLVPTLDGMPFFHKPPLFYWLTALGMELFGANQWGARVASTFSAILAVAVTHLFLRRHSDQGRANLTAAVLVTQPFFFAGAQFANLDMLVASMITVCVITGADAVLKLERGLPYQRALTACYAFAALGVLAKGLIGLVLPGAILLAWILLRGKYRLIPRLLGWPFILLFLVLAAPWFVWMQKSYDGFWDYFFIYHHFKRFAEAGFNNQTPFWFYLPVLLAFTLPWSPWIFRAASRRFISDALKSDVRALMLVWLLVIIAFFSIPKSKLVGYILPALAPFAFLIADVILLRLRARPAGNTAILTGVGMAGAALLCVGFILGISRHDPSKLRLFAGQAGDRFKPGEQVVMLGDYQYDLPFYLKARRQAWVVGDWDDPAIMRSDTWRKELYDAGQFDRTRMRAHLISPDEFLARACSYPAPLWVWGKNSDAQRYPFLNARAVVFANRSESLWRVDEQVRRDFRLCEGKPNSG